MKIVRIKLLPGSPAILLG